MSNRARAIYRVGSLVYLALAGVLWAEQPQCKYKEIDIDRYGGELLRLPPVIRSVDRDLDVRLTVAYSEQTIAGCKTRLRLYDQMLTGPTLEAAPGDTLNIDVVNHLPPDTQPHPADINKPHGFNRTNLHTHGLHVSPAGNSDNVLLEVHPGRAFRNEIKIPRDHPPGTFWYHPHVHGATAIQVGSGMAGALIVRGGIDHLPQIERMAEQIMVFQQIPYDEKGEVEDFKEVFGHRTWGKQHRRTTINGQIYPVIYMRPGEIQRWRMIHAGVRESLGLILQGHSLHEISVDGLVTGRIDSWNRLDLEPGYRSDVLVQASHTRGEYFLYDGETAKGLHGEEKRRRLAKVVIEGPPVSMAMPSEAALRRFVPFSPIERIDGEQQVTFNIAKDGGGIWRYTVNGREFSPNHRRILELGMAEEWTLNSEFANHPFHIHVNPFEHERKGPDGHLQRVWRDTLLVRRDEPVKIRTRYTKYIGTFVLHCHILDHEDQGMMELVEVRLPGSPPYGQHAHGEHLSAPMSKTLSTETSEVKRVRKNIDDLTTEELADYLHAVRRLKKISEEDPLSKDGYQYFADLHNTSKGPCEHQRDTFLPWHRAHLLEFENALRRSDPPRTSNVTVPYWDWSRLPSGQRFPRIFEDQGSVLFFKGREEQPICRSTQQTDCVPLLAPWHKVNETLKEATRWEGPGVSALGGKSNGAEDCRLRRKEKSGALEQPVHNSMHSLYVGGVMAGTSQAANDPIFWSFHSFIDLLWDYWQKLPSSAQVDSCLNCHLCGLFENSQTGSGQPWTVDKTVSTQELGYRYAFIPPPLEVAHEATRNSGFPFDSHPVAGWLGEQPPQPVSGGDWVVPRRVDQTVSLRLESVPMPSDVSYHGEIYLHPVTEPFEPTNLEFRRQFLVDYYGIWEGHGHHPRPDTEIVIDLTDEVSSLSTTHVGERWRVSVAVVLDEDSAEELGEAADAKVAELAFGALHLDGVQDF